MSEPTRDDLRTRAMRRALGSAVSVESPWTLIVVAGGEAGTVVEDVCWCCRDHGGCVVVDVAELVLQHPEAANNPHEACRRVAWEIWHEALRQRKNIVLEAPLDDDRIREALIAAGSAGYRRMLFVTGGSRCLGGAAALVLNERLVEEIRVAGIDRRLVASLPPLSWEAPEITKLSSPAAVGANSQRIRKIKLGDFSGTGPSAMAGSEIAAGPPPVAPPPNSDKVARRQALVEKLRRWAHPV